MDQLVVFAFALSVIIELLLPFAFAFWASRKFGLSWKVFGLGVLAFVLIQLIHAPLTFFLGGALGNEFTSQPIGFAVYALSLGLLAGLFEEVGRFAVFKYLFPRFKFPLSGRNALMLGAGWGGIESILVGLILALTMVAYMSAAPLTGPEVVQLNQTLNGTLTGAQLNTIQSQLTALMNLTPLEVLPSALERLMAFTLQLAFTAMVFIAVTEKRNELLLLAILWHTAVDASAVMLLPAVGAWATEGAILVYALIAAYYLKKVWPKLVERPPAETPL